jgi:hypothetical protein
MKSIAIACYSFVGTCKGCKSLYGACLLYLLRLYIVYFYT